MNERQVGLDEMIKKYGKEKVMKVLAMGEIGPNNSPKYYTGEIARALDMLELDVDRILGRL